mgnify:CR=1 FL=1
MLPATKSTRRREESPADADHGFDGGDKKKSSDSTNKVAMKTLRDTFAPTNLSIIAINVLCFVICQCLFFFFVGSKLYDRTVEDKGKILRSMLENLPPEGKLVACAKIKETMMSLPDEDASAMDAHNIKLLISTAMPFVIGSLVIALLCIGHALHRNHWKKQHTGAVVLVFCCFLTEIFIYKALIQQYVILQDSTIIEAVIGTQMKE